MPVVRAPILLAFATTLAAAEAKDLEGPCNQEDAIPRSEMAGGGWCWRLITDDAVLCSPSQGDSGGDWQADLSCTDGSFPGAGSSLALTRIQMHAVGSQGVCCHHQDS